MGPNERDATLISASSSLILQEMNEMPVTLRLDVKNDESPITVGMEVKFISITNNLKFLNTLTIKHPSDKSPRTLQTYTSGNSPLDVRKVY